MNHYDLVHCFMPHRCKVHGSIYNYYCLFNLSPIAIFCKVSNDKLEMGIGVRTAKTMVENMIRKAVVEGLQI